MAVVFVGDWEEPLWAGETSGQILSAENRSILIPVNVAIGDVTIREKLESANFHEAHIVVGNQNRRPFGRCINDESGDVFTCFNNSISQRHFVAVANIWRSRQSSRHFDATKQLDAERGAFSAIRDLEIDRGMSVVVPARRADIVRNELLYNQNRAVAFGRNIGTQFRSISTFHGSTCLIADPAQSAQTDYSRDNGKGRQYPVRPSWRSKRRVPIKPIMIQIAVGILSLLMGGRLAYLGGGRGSKYSRWTWTYLSGVLMFLGLGCFLALRGCLQ